MTTRYIIISAGTSNVMTTSITTMLIFIENKTSVEGDKIAFKSSYDKHNLTIMIISYIF